MVKCSVLGCKNYSYKKGISESTIFFTFPKDINLINIWKKSCGAIKNVKNARICSEHFIDDDWTLKDKLLNISMNKRRLKSDAVPTRNIKNPEHKLDRQRRCKKKLQKREAQNAIAAFENQEDHKYNHNNDESETSNCIEGQTEIDDEFLKEVKIMEQKIEIRNLKRKLEEAEEINKKLKKAFGEIITKGQIIKKKH